MNAPFFYRSREAALPHARAVNRCAHCGGKFGLIRHTRARKQFCSTGCVEAYLHQPRIENKRWLGTFTPPAE